MKKQLNRYKFEKISGAMAKEFGTIKVGHEDEHSMMLLSMEGNLLKLNREEEKRDGRRVVEDTYMFINRRGISDRYRV